MELVVLLELDADDIAALCVWLFAEEDEFGNNDSNAAKAL
jgi:hypothetical protein